MKSFLVASLLLAMACASALGDEPGRKGGRHIRPRGGADCTSNSLYPGNPPKIQCLNDEKNRIEAKIDGAASSLQQAIDKLRIDHDAKLADLQRQINELTLKLNDRVTRQDLEDRLAKLQLTPGMIGQITKLVEDTVADKTGNFLRSGDEVQLLSRVEHWFCAIWTGENAPVYSRDCNSNAAASLWLLKLTKHN